MIEKIYRLIYNLRGTFIMEKYEVKIRGGTLWHFFRESVYRKEILRARQTEENFSKEQRLLQRGCWQLPL